MSDDIILAFIRIFFYFNINLIIIYKYNIVFNLFTNLIPGRHSKWRPSHVAQPAWHPAGRGATVAQGRHCQWRPHSKIDRARRACWVGSKSSLPVTTQGRHWQWRPCYCFCWYFSFPPAILTHEPMFAQSQNRSKDFQNSWNSTQMIYACQSIKSKLKNIISN